ncbi:MAG: GTP-binding protein [Caldilineaceae bacterium]
MPTRLIIVGGFLGAGKTTLLLTAANHLVQQGYRVGLVTNDQGEDLVDTATADQATIPVTEVAGGCFCCRFPDLLQGLQRLQTSVNPDIILAEPVGSCTDLVATVLRPLAQLHGEQYHLAPLTVLLDGTRDLAHFSSNVHYLYQQQLAEAELILLNKIDQLTPAQQRTQLDGLRNRYPQAHPLLLAARQGLGVAEWLEIALGQVSRNPAALLIDYTRYAEAEAALGWLNAKGLVRADDPFAAATWVEQLLTGLAQRFAAANAAIAHIKTLVTTPVANLKASITQAGGPVTWDVVAATTETTQLDFLLNVRVHAPPPLLATVVEQTLAATKPQPGARHYFEHFECFSPLPPKPTYRME